MLSWIEYSFYKQPFRLLYYKGLSLTSKSSGRLTSQSPNSRMISSKFPIPTLADSILAAWLSISNTKGGFIRSWCYWEGKAGGWKIRLEVGGNRWCMCKNGPHKSNHIYFIVNLSQCIFYQKCHDVDCANFISQGFPIQPSEAQLAEMYFDLEKAEWKMWSVLSPV